MIQQKIVEIPDQAYSDSARLKKYLQQAELLLAESYTLILKIKQDNPQTDDELVSNVADSWHYSIEAINTIHGA